MARQHLRWIAIAIALAVGAMPAVAQWKWRDKSGRITVSDLPPPRDVAEADILQRPQPGARPLAMAKPAASTPAPAAKAMVDDQLRARREEADKQQQAAADEQARQQAAAREENCRNARSHLAAMESGQRLLRINEKGEREFLDDKQRAAEAQRAREVIQSDCR